ncbi:MAG: hypothetical protein ACK55Z_09490 [bacterium]
MSPRISYHGSDSFLIDSPSDAGDGVPSTETRFHLISAYHFATVRDCNGSSFCEHNKRKSRCRDCGGGSICEHG